MKQLYIVLFSQNMHYLKLLFRAWILVIFTNMTNTRRGRAYKMPYSYGYFMCACAPLDTIFILGETLPPFRLSLLAIPILWCSCNIKFDSWVSHNSIYLLHFAPYLWFIPYPLSLSLYILHFFYNLKTWWPLNTIDVTVHTFVNKSHARTSYLVIDTIYLYTRLCYALVPASFCLVLG